MSLLYTDKASLENYLLTDIDVSFDAQVDEWIEAMSLHIDFVTGRTFVADEGESDQDNTRSYDGTGRATLLVDDFITLHSVTVGDVLREDVLTYPSNSIPKCQLYHAYGFPHGRQNVVVEATWGYSEEPPADIKFACTVLVAGIIQLHVNTDGAIKREKIGNYEVWYSDKQQSDLARTKDILNSYRKYAL